MNTFKITPADAGLEACDIAELQGATQFNGVVTNLLAGAKRLSRYRSV